MCLETFNHFRCGHMDYLDADPCPYLEEIQYLTQKRGRRYRDHRIDRLYERCEDVNARRVLTVRSKCPCCEADDEHGAEEGYEVRDAGGGDDEEMDGASSDCEEVYVGALRTLENEMRARERRRFEENGEISKAKEMDRGKLSDEDKEKYHTSHAKKSEASSPKGAGESLFRSQKKQQGKKAIDIEDSEEMQM